MDRIWQWAWTRYAPRYSWAMCAISVPLALQNYLLFAGVEATGDAVLLTQQTVDALVSKPSGLADRGFHALKGKASEVRVFGLQATDIHERITHGSSSEG